MATMVKEKRKEKKRSKERSSANRELSPVTIDPPLLEELVHITETASGIETFETDIIESNTQADEVIEDAEISNISIEIIEHSEETDSEKIIETNIGKKEDIAQPSCIVDQTEHMNETPQIAEIDNKSKFSAREVSSSSIEGSYKELSKQLERIAIQNEVKEVTEGRDYELVQETHETSFECVEDIMPSAPCFEEVPQKVQYEEVFVENKPRVKCMALEDAIKLCGGKEMEEVKAMSEREEEIVEAGPLSGPEHPLVDLLSTFRSSLIAVERERIQLACGFAEEEKRRASLWKIEKRYVNLSEKCKCGLDVHLRASYEYAELVKERLPVAKLRLESLLRDVQDSYCHHQHAALLAHCQIEELISETIQSNKNVIREALSLILQALRLSDNAPEALASALQRWAAALSAALLDNRDLRQLLFLMHHLFRQSRSVQWASLVIHLNVDAASPWRILALLSLLLARPRTDTALECIEEAEEAWEEVDAHGGAGAVSSGTLRERDLLALLAAFPLRDLVARLVLFTHADIRHARPNEWGDCVGGRGVVQACAGVRVLLHVLHTAARAHLAYVRLHRALRDLAARALHALASLHLTSRTFYARELEEKISAELEASFSAGFNLFEAQELDKLPATLLGNNTVKDYCISIIIGLHDTSPKQLELLSIELPVLPCDVRIRIIAQAVVDRTQDHELARIVLEFLLQTGLKRKSVSCKGMCEAVARECVGLVVAAHPYLHSTALHILADLNIVETLDPSCVKTLNVHKWRPNCLEVHALLDDWARRCQQFLQYLLLELDYTPYVGLPLDVQLTVGSWLCGWVVPLGSTPAWCWDVLRRLRLHRACWRLPLDAPAPHADPTDLFGTAYALYATSYGHCIPVICSEGVAALCKLAAARPHDAVQCLAGVMLVMAHSPESVAYTPKFTELFTTLLSSGPTLMQRALGRGGATGSELLLRLILAQLSDDGAVPTSGVLSAWLQACWRPQVPAACGLVDAAACATRLWPHLDAYANALVQDENAKDHIGDAVRNAGTAPLLCECVLRAWHALREVGTRVHARLLTALHLQRVAQHKIHVDNALQKIGANITSEELVIYRAATAALAAPMNHPAHLTLWRLFMHLYLQTPPDYGSVPAVGPLFFSGLIKSRTLSQIKRRLLETITYHHNEGESLKTEHKSIDTSESSEAQSINRVERATPVRADDGLLPALSIIDLTGESSGSSDNEDSVDDSRSEKETSPNSDAAETKRNIFNLIAYHAAAEKLLNEYLCWLEQGDKVRVAPHFADIARYVPEHALEAAWKRAVSRPPPSAELDSFPSAAVPPPPDDTPPQTPFHVAVDNILKIKDRSRKRRRRTLIKSPVDDVDFRDARTLISLVDKHLNDIEKLAQEWCTEVGRVSSLDSRLWELVGVLRVRRALPPVRKNCANNCKPITIYIPEQEWCISVDAERGIRENRSSARASVRRLARARPHAARTAAALHTIARRSCSSEAAVRVVERAWRCAGAAYCSACAPASTVLTQLVSDLAERWICHDGRISSDLVSAWGKRSTVVLQQTLCGALLAPRRLPAADWPKVYIALLDSQLPSHTVFSYLSKFEMSRWSESAEPTQRRDMLEALIRAVQRWGPTPSTEHHMLVELLGVHSAVLVDSREVCAHVLRCVTAAINNTLPPAHWTHIVKAVDAKAATVPFDQLGHLLRSLGVAWWEVRTGVRGARHTAHTAHTAHAVHVAALLHATQRAFVAAATKLSYEPERVAWYAWGALQESWGPWISPHPAAPPLLPSTSTPEREAYTPMLTHFVDNVHQIMLDCPGSEIHLLQQIFEWSVQAYVNVQGSHAASAPGASTQESRVQASALLAELAKLPWSEHQWFYGKCLQQALQISSSTDSELTSWCCRVWRGTLAGTLLRDCDSTQLAPHLASLLYLFTGTHLPHDQQILDEACKLPWYRLPELAFDEALDRFFMLHHDPAFPYHDLPQFRLILVACGLSVVDGNHVRSDVRARGVSQWTRGACAPTLVTHVPAHTVRVLHTVTELAPYLEEASGEVEELLSRAVVIMCMEPAASAALPVWVTWVTKAPPRLVRACVSAVATLTAFEYFATLADAAVRALLLSIEPHGWREITARWASCPWREAHTLVQRGRLHAAYACALTHAHAPTATRAALSAILAADIHFVDNEPIIAVWICYGCRMALTHGDAEREDAARECGAAARALLARWTEQTRRSILRVVTMHADTDKPTALHRLLCRYAQCVLSPDDNTRRAYEAACSATLGANNDVSSWAGSPQLDKLVRLAGRLWPKYEKYFHYEMELAPRVNVVSV